MKTKQLLFILITLALCSNVSALDITEVHYNPTGSEYELEFVELYSEQEIDVGGWWLNTSSSERDVTIPQGTIIPANNYFLIADEGFSLAKPTSWAAANYEEDMTLANTGGFVKLFSSQGLEAEVEWGSGGEEGQSLSLVNSQYTYAPPTPSGLTGLAQSIAIELILERTAPQILTLEIEDEDLSKEGIQVFPFPGLEKEKPIWVTYEGDVDELSISFNEEELGNVSAIPIPYSLPPGIYQISVIVCGIGGCSGMSTSIEVESVLGFEVDASLLSIDNLKVEGDLDFSTPAKPTVRNSGNTPLQLEISTSGLSWNESSIPPSSVAVSLTQGGPFYELTSPLAVELDVLGATMLSLKFDPPSQLPAGIYNGEIMLRAS